MNAGTGHAGRLHDHLDARIGDQRLGAIGDRGGARLVRVGKRCCGILGVRPAGSLELRAGARHIEIGDSRDMHAARQPCLRQKHGAEFAGADHTDRDRFSGRLAFKKFGMKVHVTRSRN